MNGFVAGFIYAVASADLVKIGWSWEPVRRFSELRRACPNAVLLGFTEANRCQEKEVHAKLARWRRTGEWFAFEGDVVKFVGALTPYIAPPPIPSKPKPKSAVDLVIDALGGTGATARLTRSKPQSVTNWRRTGRIASRTFLIMTAELERRGLSANPSLWSIKDPEQVE